jgi:hypothetical protein
LTILKPFFNQVNDFTKLKVRVVFESNIKLTALLIPYQHEPTDPKTNVRFSFPSNQTNA